MDAEAHEVVGPLAADCGELTALTLWLLAEKARGTTSAYSGLLGTLPVRVKRLNGEEGGWECSESCVKNRCVDCQDCQSHSPRRLQ